jgi:hypothetical protein
MCSNYKKLMTLVTQVLLQIACRTVSRTFEKTLQQLKHDI